MSYVTLPGGPITGQVMYKCLHGQASKTRRLHVGQSIPKKSLVFYQTVPIEASSKSRCNGLENILPSWRGLLSWHLQDWHEALTHCWLNVGPPSQTVTQHSTSHGSMPLGWWAELYIHRCRHGTPLTENFGTSESPLQPRTNSGPLLTEVGPTVYRSSTSTEPVSH